ncbi:MAG TPA: PH domain-containing protein [Thermoplasmata archaeon]|nr:PH domain-containing protein [Thermoplasmata archaeon]
MSGGRSYTLPRLLKATYLAEGEGLLRETRATKLYYFPGPILALLFFGVLDYSAGSVVYGWPQIAYVGTAITDLGNLVHSAQWVFLGLLFLLIVSLLWLIVRYVRWISTVYGVTTNRVIVQSGIVGRDFDEIPVTQVRGVDVRQSAGQRILGYGTVRVSSEGGSNTAIGNEDWLGIPHPFEFQKLIESAMQSYSRGAPAPPPAPR